ncbi:MAG: FAD-dependent oxidoreductase [Eubacteriales bacterium]|nr:FAD-dependent oxidoreductase [Eubacteriales bacterium]
MNNKDMSRRSFLKGAAAMGLMGVGGFAGLGRADKVKAEEGVFTPGTYTASATGMMSEVTVSITVDESSILSATVNADGETAEIGKAAADTLAEQILAVQSQEIDGVTGATRTTEAVRKACESCIAQAKGIDVSLLQSESAEEEAAVDWLGAEPEIADSEIAETVDCDVLVVGAGHAGTFAAAAAAESGAKTILIEKFAHDMASGMRDTLAAVNSKQQIENNDNPDAKEVMKYLVDWSQGYCDRRLAKAFVENSGETMDWYTEVLKEQGMDFMHEVDDPKPEDNYKTLDVGHSIQYGDEYYEQLTMDKVFAYAQEKGLEIQYETTMVKLVKDGERVSGLIATRADGSYVKFNAAKGVILCTGGYSANDDMMKALQPWTLEQTCINYSKSGSKGDGIRACLWAGAAMDTTHTSMIFERGAIRPDAVGQTGDGRLFWMGSQPFLKVNLNGQRFMNEYMPYDYVLHAAASQPEHTYCQVWDSNYQEYCEKFETHGCSRLFPHKNGTAPVFSMGYVAEMNQGLIDEGFIVVADTIEELAEKLGLPAENFKATVERYNELADLGEDEDFGKEAYRLSHLDTAPFYGVRQSGGYLICTMDGIRIDENMHAIREDGTAIEGLYVCGDCSGSYFHGSYPNLLAGAAAGRSATFARMAGKNAVNEI